MSAGARLVDYFSVCGLDVGGGLEPDKLAGDSLHIPPLDRPYKCQVLSNYPELSPCNPFDKQAVAMLCYPKGLRFATQKDTREPYFHSFILTREDGSRSYGCTLTFFEQVETPAICEAMQTLQAMHMAELSNIQSRTLYSHLGHVHTRSPKRGYKPAPETVGRVYDMHQDTLFSNKCLCVISQLPLIVTFERLLRDLHQAITSNTETPLPLECYVYNLLFEIPVPPPGRSLKLHTVSNTFVTQRPGVGELPLLDYPLREIFHLLGVDNVLSVFSSLLLERQILLYSQDYQRLMLVAEGISALMFPFQWQHVYVPILPASLLHFLDAPVPFVMGLHHSTDGKSLMQRCVKANMCFVNIDEGTVEVPEELPVFPNRSDLRDELLLHLNFQFDNLNSHTGTTRDSGFRESYIGCDSGLSSEATSTTSSTWSLASKLELLQQSEALAKITALAKRTGVITSLEDISDSLSLDDKKTTVNRVADDKYVVELICNNYLREIFLHYFLQIFSSYESFVIQPSQDMDAWLNNRETMQNFDKAAFLSDQPKAHLPFLSAFIETQMFTTLIDNKIIAQWEDADMNLRVFEARLQYFRERTSDQRVPQYHRHSMCTDSGSTPKAPTWIQHVTKESMVEKRACKVDLVAPVPHFIEGLKPKPRRVGFFPQLHSAVLSTEPSGNKSARWRKKERIHQHSEHLRMSSDQREKYIQEARGKGSRQPKLSDIDPKRMAQTNWKFVEQLLKECKTKTKRMLVEKMGQEAVELGHGEPTIIGVEENTLIASLCDLLERIWSHGLQNNQGKSALWSHLLSYQAAEEAEMASRSCDASMLSPASASGTLTPTGKVSPSQGMSPSPSPAATPSPSPAATPAGPPPPGSHFASAVTDASDLSNVALENETCPSGTQTWPVRRHKRKASRGLELPILNPHPISVLFDMRNIQRMSEIKTEVGYARAWVRLSLEKKLLSRHLKELLSNTDLLKNLYKRYAFLRCEDEREQFLYHLLSLNAVDYYCFTNTFPSATIPYRVMIFPRQKLGGGSTTANSWLSLSGQLRESPRISVPKHSLDISAECKNLGVLTTLRIGHDNAGMSPRWMVEHILTRNEITGQTYRFPCGRWLGKGVDDGSTERLLVAEIVPPTTDHQELMEKCRTPPRCRSPSMPRKTSEPKIKVSDIQEMLGDAVNNLVKHFYKPEKERGSLTALLCGEYGLVYCMEHVFQCGFKSSRLFRNRFFVWDFLEKVQVYFDSLLSEGHRYELSDEAKMTMRSFCHVVNRINSASQTVGKDGRFQVFICIGVRDHMLQRWIKTISRTPVTLSMYEEKSFLREQSLITFLVQILDSLGEFNFNLEASLIKGVEV